MKKAIKVIAITIAIILMIAAIAAMLILLAKKSNFTLLEKLKHRMSNTDETEEVTPTYIDLPEVLEDLINGDVVKLQDNCYQINGTVTEKYTPSYGYASYVYSDGEVTEDTSISSVRVDCTSTEISDAISQYVAGDYQPLVNLINIPEIKFDENGKQSTEAATFYQYTSFNGVVPVIYNTVGKIYTMVVPDSDGYYLVTSTHDFRLVNKRPTAVYDNPAERSMYNYTYSTYELDAINNTRAALSKDGSTTIETQVNIPSSESADNSKYVSMPDQYTREAMLKYKDYKWNPDGTTPDASDELDITSAAATASQWTLTSSAPYSWTNCGLKLAGLTATRTSDSFVVKGTVTNLLNNQRPWVLVIKYLDAAGKLLHVSCVDRTSDAIEPYGYADFSYTLDNKGVNINAIQTLQFEIY